MLTQPYSKKKKTSWGKIRKEQRINPKLWNFLEIILIWLASSMANMTIYTRLRDKYSALPTGVRIYQVRIPRARICYQSMLSDLPIKLTENSILRSWLIWMRRWTCRMNIIRLGLKSFSSQSVIRQRSKNSKYKVKPPCIDSEWCILTTHQSQGKTIAVDLERYLTTIVQV